jgi:hypothetical protein
MSLDPGQLFRTVHRLWQEVGAKALALRSIREVSSISKEVGVAAQCVAILFDGNPFQPANRCQSNRQSSRERHGHAHACGRQAPVTDANQTASRSSSNSAFHMHALPQWRTTDTRLYQSHQSGSARCRLVSAGMQLARLSLRLSVR